MIKDASAFGIVNPCPPAIYDTLLTWFRNLGFQNVPLSRIAAQLVIRWEDQGVHKDDPRGIGDIVTLDVASAGGLKIVAPEFSMKGSYIWHSYSKNAFRHYAFCGLVPGSEVVGRISLVFRKYLFDLPLIPLSGKVLGHVRCNELLNYCVQKELLPHFTSSHQFMTHYELCTKLILVSQLLSCLKPGGYLKTDGFGYAPSLKSVYSAMTVQEKEATIPGLTLGEILPESFHIPYGSFDSLWTLGFHCQMMGTTVHSNSIDGLWSIAIQKEKIHICDTCPLPLPFPESHLKNFLCQNGCCAAI